MKKVECWGRALRPLMGDAVNCSRSMRRCSDFCLAGIVYFSLALPALAAQGLDGAALGPAWALPFAGILLSIALGPILAPRYWEHHHGAIAALWCVLTLVPLALLTSPAIAQDAVIHMLLTEYLPFVLLLLALFTTSGGIVLKGTLRGTAATNTAILALGTLFASVIGTTGASMVLVRPLIRANRARARNVHVFVFFIFLVSNIGGALSPLGDPPLFLGFLKGVDFLWTARNLWPQTAFCAGILLAVFFLLDWSIARAEPPQGAASTSIEPLRLSGSLNLLLIALIIGAMVMSAAVPLGSLTVFGVPVSTANLVRDALMVAVTLASLALTRAEDRRANGFSWFPIREVAVIFLGIFVCIIPVMAMLQAGEKGVFAPLLALVSRADGTADVRAYFWLTGVLSSLLDNAPTYLVFFQLATVGLGDDAAAAHLMGPGAATLAAISMGAVFMGANTYIGNAPNFMVYAVAREGGIRMPGFFGYVLWSGCILLPLFGALTLIFIH